MTAIVATLCAVFLAAMPEPPPKGPNDVRINLGLDDVNLADLANSLNLKLPVKIGGRGSIRLHGVIPLDSPQNLDAYDFEGTVNLPNLTLNGIEFRAVKAHVKLLKGVLHFDQLEAELPAGDRVGTIRGSATVGLDKEAAISGKLDLTRLPFSVLNRIAPAFDFGGELSAHADLEGKLDPDRFLVSGTVQAEQFNVQSFRVEKLSAGWSVNPRGVMLRDIAAQLYGGQVSGSGSWPFDPSEPAKLDLAATQLDAAKLSRDAQSPLPLEGTADGTLSLTVPPAEGKNREVKAELKVEADRLRVRGIPARRLRGGVHYREGRAEYRLKGETLGGSFDVEGQYPPDMEKQGRLKISEIRLARLVSELGLKGIEPLDGTVSVSLDWQPSQARGMAVVSGVTWAEKPVSEQLRAVLTLTPEELRIREVSGPLAGGELRGQITLGLTPGRQRYLSLTMENVDSAKLLSHLFPDSALIEGPMTLRLRGRLGSEWSGTGEWTLNRGQFFGVGIREGRFPLNWTWTPGESAEVRVAEASAQIGSGRAQGQMTLAVGSESRLDCDVRFMNVDLREAVGSLKESRTLGGLATGRLTLASRELTSPSALTGSLDATLTQSQPFGLPVLRDLAPFILTGRSSSTPFSQGEIRATLGNGLIRLHRFAIAGDVARLHMEGVATLGGRLDLHAIAATNLRAIPLSLVQRSQLLAGGPLSASQLNDLNTAISGLTVRLHVGGSFNTPTVRLETAGLIAQAVLRFLLLADFPSR